MCHLGICAWNAGGVDSYENLYSKYMDVDVDVDVGCVAQPLANPSIGLRCPGPAMPQGWKEKSTPFGDHKGSLRIAPEAARCASWVISDG